MRTASHGRDMADTQYDSVNVHNGFDTFTAGYFFNGVVVVFRIVRLRGSLLL